MRSQASLTFLMSIISTSLTMPCSARSPSFPGFQPCRSPRAVKIRCLRPKITLPPVNGGPVRSARRPGTWVASRLSRPMYGFASWLTGMVLEQVPKPPACASHLRRIARDQSPHRRPGAVPAPFSVVVIITATCAERLGELHAHVAEAAEADHADLLGPGRPSNGPAATTW